jgi:hypothetical protein
MFGKGLFLWSILIFSTACFASEEHDDFLNVIGHFVDGNKYNTFSEHERLLYLQGLIDGLFLYQGGESARNSLRACTIQKPLGQLEAIYEKYLKEHPEDWHKPASVLFWISIHSTCK